MFLRKQKQFRACTNTTLDHAHGGQVDPCKSHTEFQSRWKVDWLKDIEGLIDWSIVSYDSAIKQTQYCEPSRNKETNCQWKSE